MLLIPASLAQTLINVRLAGDTPGVPSGAGVIGSPGDSWNYYPNLSGRANGGGVVTNATTIRNSNNTVLPGVSMTVSLSGGDGLDRYTDNSAYNPIPQVLMGQYVYESNGVNYWTFTFSGLQSNRTYLLYGMGNGNQSGQGSTWWVDIANGHATASATANFSSGDRNATLAGNEGICWVKLPATTTGSGALTFRVVRLGAAENGSGGSGRAYLNAFQLQLLSAPTLSGLTNQTVVAGTTAVLGPVIGGTPVPSCQWRSNNVALTGQTNASLVLNNVQYSQNGAVYSLVASNFAGAVTNTMTLTVIVTPTITGLAPQAAYVGSDIIISPTVSGIPTPALRWLFNGTNLNDGPTGNGSILSGSTTNTLAITNAQSGDTGTYSLVASNSAGTVTNSMTLTVSTGDVAPGITNLTDKTVVQGGNAMFTANVQGLPVPTLRWQVNGTDVANATNTSLTVSNVQFAQSGYVYSLIASNSAGARTNTAQLFVQLPPAISQHPTNISVGIGTPAAFNVTASGVPAVAYRWRKNGSPIANATNASYTIASAQGSDNGAVYSVVVSNTVLVDGVTSSNAIVISSNATLTVLSTMTGAFLPTNNATAISPDQQLRIVFSKTPHLGSAGKVYVRDASNNSIFATIDVSQFQTFSLWSATISNAAVRTVQGSTCFYMPIAIYGNEAWITFNPTNRFAYNKTYYVNVDAGVFLDSSNAAFAPITGTNTWRFATKTAGPTTPTASTGPTNITVALNGAGDFATLQGASDWIPQNNTLLRTITVQPGTYREFAIFTQNRNKVRIIGAGASRADVQINYPYPAYSTANDRAAGTLRLESSDIYVRNLTIDNEVYLTNNGVMFAGPINTVVTTGNRLIFDNVLIKGGQDTLYTDRGIAYFNRCEIWGSVDFIYGSALSVFDQCDIVEIRSSGGPITAPSTDDAAPYGLVFLNCKFPRALTSKGYPYDVGTGSTTFMRPWRQDGFTAIINCQLDSEISTKGWSEWVGAEGAKEVTCRAREYGTSLIGGGAAPTIGQRQAAGAYWLNTYDPDYNPAAGDLPSDPDLAPGTGTGNRLPVTVNPADYTHPAIFGNTYFNLNGWLPTTIPTITSQPTNQTVNPGSPVSFAVAAVGLPAPTYQWRKNGVDIPNATNATFNIASAMLADSAIYSVSVFNSAGSVTSADALLAVPAQPTLITCGASNGMLYLSWSADGVGFRVQAQTNSSGSGLTTNWTTVANSNNTNQLMVPIDRANGSVFFRLIHP